MNEHFMNGPIRSPEEPEAVYAELDAKFRDCEEAVKAAAELVDAKLIAFKEAYERLVKRSGSENKESEEREERRAA
jgi:hypothetical protein